MVTQRDCELTLSLERAIGCRFISRNEIDCLNQTSTLEHLFLFLRGFISGRTDSKDPEVVAQFHRLESCWRHRRRRRRNEEKWNVQTRERRLQLWFWGMVCAKCDCYIFESRWGLHISSKLGGRFLLWFLEWLLVLLALVNHGSVHCSVDRLASLIMITLTHSRYLGFKWYNAFPPNY